MGGCVWRPARIFRANPLCPARSGQTQAFRRLRRFAPIHTLLLDRELERGQIDRVLETARRRRSGALVLQGEPGTGKTTLLDYAVESGGDFEIVRLLGIESETEFGFAALHQLLLPFLAGLRSLPAPQRDALAGALGLRRADSPDRFLLALGCTYHAGPRRRKAAAAVHRR